MKALFILLLLPFTVFSQQNPWKNQGTVNPWGNQTKTEQKKDSIETKNDPIIKDSAQTAKNQPLKDSIQTNALQTKNDSGSVALIQLDESGKVLSEQRLIEAAQDQVEGEYKRGNDFAIGVTTGLFLNVFALTPDIVYVLIDTKQEKALQSKIETDSTYSAVDDVELKSKTRNKIKSKKFFATIGGTAVGSLAQILFFAAILTAI